MISSEHSNNSFVDHWMFTGHDLILVGQSLYLVVHVSWWDMFLGVRYLSCDSLLGEVIRWQKNGAGGS